MDSQQNTNIKTRIYPYFDRSFPFELVLFIFFGPVLVSLWFTVVFYYFYSGQLAMPIARLAIYFTVAFILSRLAYGNVRAGRRSKAVVIEGGRIVKRGPRGVSVANCADIGGIRGLKVPLVKGWAALETPAGPFVIPVCLHNGHRMVARIFRIIQESGTFLKDAGRTKERLCGIARRFNVLYSLRERHFHNLVRAATAVALLNYFVSAYFWERGLVDTVLYGIFGMFSQIAAYLVAEKVHLRRLVGGDGSGGDGEGEDEDQGGPYILFGLVALLVGMAAGVLFTEPG
jgi:hypothetical protein